MWNKRSLLLRYRVRVHTKKRRMRIRLSFAIYVIHQLLLSVQGIAGLIPGRAGRYTRIALDSLHGLVFGIMALPPQELINVKVTAEGKPIEFSAKTTGLGG